MGSKTNIGKMEILMEVFKNNGYFSNTYMGLHGLEVRSDMKIDKKIEIKV